MTPNLDEMLDLSFSPSDAPMWPSDQSPIFDESCNPELGFWPSPESLTDDSQLFQPQDNSYGGCIAPQDLIIPSAEPVLEEKANSYAAPTTKTMNTRGTKREEFASRTRQSVCSMTPKSKRSPVSAPIKRKDSSPIDDLRLDHIPLHRSSHNEIEKRYRNRLNHHIAILRDCVPNLRQAAEMEDGDDAEMCDGGSRRTQQINKATVLREATEYIRELEQANQAMMMDKKLLKERIGTYEKLLMWRSAQKNQQYQPPLGLVPNCAC